MNLRFACPGCGDPASVEIDAARDRQCSRCDHLLRIAPPEGSAVADCLVCGNHELYKKKDFPQWLGMSVLALACTAFLIFTYFYHQWIGLTILIVSAVFDLVLYRWVGDAAVCYRCRAEHRKLPPPLNYPAFELAVAERYRQERIRKEMLREQRSG